MHHGNIIKDIASLVIPMRAIASDLPMEEVAELFLDAEYADVLSLPIVDDGSTNASAASCSASSRSARS